MVGEAFRSINELMDNYTRTIMYQANGDPVPLTYVRLLSMKVIKD